MRFVLIAALAVSVVGCTRWSMDHHLNNAYRAYDAGSCERVMLELSQVDRASRARRYIQPEVSMLRGQCLERQKLFVDAAQTYQFIITQYPTSEYAYRARARLDTLQQLGHYPANGAAQVRRTAL
ncbi:tetratricopeptide repeat protein [Pseudomonas sp. MSSRFD41]|uniref:tetratricopeptide repeat protein n=1 Tax=unclassified Pseudomonas TaxID=196821 RepID=UPI0016399ECF|nr:tetratricopeptide repeat protein [Pseudomonas sp. MSSRFD41]MBC2655883.1 tetratricopeptide repeat protein [Pseudomonas sp. MSSRFD41]